MLMVRTELTPLEIATGVVFDTGRLDEVEPVPSRDREAPLAALERALIPSLERAPCLVSFSGGRDSSCVLAAAVDLARREGLPLPIPATNRFAGVSSAEENDWQELVISHLGLEEWVRLDFCDELDVVGPVATRVLHRHGLIWPFNAHFHVPLLEQASGGSFLTGIGGDEVFGESSWRNVNDLLARRRLPQLRDALRIGAAFAPFAVRRFALARRLPADFEWLRPEGAHAFAVAWAGQLAAEPRHYADRLRWWRSLRSVQLGFKALDLLARDTRVSLIHPLADPAFGSAVARATRRDGPADRGEFMAEIFGSLLPREVFQRLTKATFDGAFWGRHARQVASVWNGEAADPVLVDIEALRGVWSSASPDSHTFSLLQAAWLELEATRARPAAVGQLEATPSSRAVAEAPTPAEPRA